MSLQNTIRFSDRVEDYIKYRPSYPAALMNLLKAKINLNPQAVIADIGSGTGISSILFLKNSNKVFAVEPNKEMREAAEHLLNVYPNFASINGTAEQTNLNTKAVDLIFCGQAFHWFDKQKSRQEFNRILKQNGHIVLAWNERSTKTPFQKKMKMPFSKSLMNINLSITETSRTLKYKTSFHQNQCTWT